MSQLPLVVYAMTPSRYFGGPGQGKYIVLGVDISTKAFQYKGLFTDADMEAAIAAGTHRFLRHL